MEEQILKEELKRAEEARVVNKQPKLDTNINRVLELREDDEPVVPIIVQSAAYNYLLLEKLLENDELKTQHEIQNSNGHINFR